MALEINPSVADALSSSVKNPLAKMPVEEQAVFEEDFVRKKRSPLVMLLLAILFPIQHFLEGRIGLGILFWITFGGLGIWWLIDIILVWGRTKNHNQDMAKTILRDMRIMNGA